MGRACNALKRQSSQHSWQLPRGASAALLQRMVTLFAPRPKERSAMVAARPTAVKVVVMAASRLHFPVVVRKWLPGTTLESLYRGGPGAADMKCFQRSRSTQNHRAMIVKLACFAEFCTRGRRMKRGHSAGGARRAGMRGRTGRMCRRAVTCGASSTCGARCSPRCGTSMRVSLFFSSQRRLRMAGRLSYL